MVNDSVLSDERAEVPPFGSQLRSGFHLVDLLVFVAPVVVMGYVFRLPLEVRRTFGFKLSDPTVATAYVSHFVHYTSSHFWSSLLGYLALVTIAYLLALANNNRTRFLIALGGILTIFPIVLSYLQLAVPRQRTVIGFSALNMALVGYTLVEFSTYLHTYITDRHRIEDAPRFFFPAISFILARYADSTVAFVVLGVSLLITAIYWLPFLLSLQSVVPGTRALFDTPGYFELAVLSMLIISVFLIGAFPQSPVVDTGLLNVYSHLLGFSIAFITFYSLSIISDRIDPTPKTVR